LNLKAIVLQLFSHFCCIHNVHVYANMIIMFSICKVHTTLVALLS
jgi:hypothetical protein